MDKATEETIYNQELKELYMQREDERRIHPEGRLKKLFKHTAGLEMELHKDVCNFTVNEIERLYSRINSPSADFINDINSNLRRYTQWCDDNGLVRDGQNHFNEFYYEKILKHTNKAAFDYSIITREQMNDWIYLLYNPCDKFIIEALYEGINGIKLCELADLRTTDFDFKEHTVVLRSGKGTKRKIPISEQLCRLASDAAMEKYFYPNNGEGAKSGDRIKFLVDDTLILKNHPKSGICAGPATIAQRLRSKILRTAMIVDAPYLNPTVIINSGRLNYVLERSKELGITGKEFVKSEHLEELNLQFNCRINKAHFLIKYRDYLE